MRDPKHYMVYVGGREDRAIELILDTIIFLSELTQEPMREQKVEKLHSPEVASKTFRETKYG